MMCVPISLTIYGTYPVGDGIHSSKPNVATLVPFPYDIILLSFPLTSEVCSDGRAKVLWAGMKVIRLTVMRKKRITALYFFFRTSLTT